MKDKNVIFILVLSLVVISLLYFNTKYSFFGTTLIHGIWTLSSFFIIFELRKKIIEHLKTK